MVLCAVVSIGTSEARADSCDDAAADATAAKKQYDAGNFVDAARLLESAYARCHKTGVLYNLGRVYQQLAMLDKALDAYKRYIDRDPYAPDAAATRETIAKLEEQLRQQREMQRRIAQEEADRRAAEERAAREAKEKQILRARIVKRSASPWPWITVALGASSLVAGGVFGFAALDRNAAAIADSSAMSAAGKQSDAVTFAAGANIAFAVGAVAIIVGAVWGIFDLRSVARTRSLALSF